VEINLWWHELGLTWQIVLSVGLPLVAYIIGTLWGHVGDDDYDTRL